MYAPPSTRRLLKYPRRVQYKSADGSDSGTIAADCSRDAYTRTIRVVWLAPGAIAPTYSLLAFISRGASTAKYESLCVSPAGGN